MKIGILFSFMLFMGTYSRAENLGILDGASLRPVSLQESLSSITPGSIVIIGENHGFLEHQRQQLEIMSQLRAQGLKVSVGMEFFTYTEQNFLDAYRSGKLNEQDFLAAIRWGSPSFDYYRAQTLFANADEGSTTWALNAPRGLTGKVSRGGLSSLTPAEAALLPPQFEVGRAEYKERFMSIMQPHLPSPEAAERYFAAQSIWDDTMAWRAAEFIQSRPDQVLVIIVGEFHVQFGGGLPDRIRKRAPRVPVLTFSQMNTEGLSEDEIKSEKNPSAKYGPRADFLWLAPAKP